MANISRRMEAVGGIIRLSAEDRIRVLIDTSKMAETANTLGVEYVHEYAPPEPALTEAFEGGASK